MEVNEELTAESIRHLTVPSGDDGVEFPTGKDTGVLALHQLQRRLLKQPNKDRNRRLLRIRPLRVQPHDSAKCG